jgi:hypothetical protein
VTGAIIKNRLISGFEKSSYKFGILSRKDPLQSPKRCYNAGQVAAGNVFSGVRQKMGKRQSRLKGVLQGL